MSHNPPNLEDLICLNHEIAALVRGGIPLEFGLRGLARHNGSRLEQLAHRLSERLASGTSLANALAQEGPAVSPVYTAVVEAGLAAGRLPQAMESLAKSGQLMLETRRRVILAVIYPIICLIFAYVLFCFFVTLIASRVLSVISLFPQCWPIDLLMALHQRDTLFLRDIPLAVCGLFVVAFVLRRSINLRFLNRLFSLRWVIGSSLKWAQFLDLLALQVEQNCPLPDAFLLAATSIDDERWEHEARDVSEQLRTGHSLAESLKCAKSMPPVLVWMLASAEKQGALAVTLRQLSETYRSRAWRRAAIMKTWLPVVMTICFTGTIGLAYGLAFFLPLRAFWQGLMAE